MSQRKFTPMVLIKAEKPQVRHHDYYVRDEWLIRQYTLPFVPTPKFLEELDLLINESRPGSAMCVFSSEDRILQIAAPPEPVVSRWSEIERQIDNLVAEIQKVVHLTSMAE